MEQMNSISNALNSVRCKVGIAIPVRNLGIQKSRPFSLIPNHKIGDVPIPRFRDYKV